MTQTRWKHFLHFALSHHWESLETACWRVGTTNWWVCARCLGLYPSMFLTLLLEPFLWAQLSQEIRALCFFITVLPGWLAWAHDRLHPQKPWPRLVATLTGVLSGVGVGLVLWAHIRDPFHALFTFILVLTGIASAGVWAVGQFLNAEEDPEKNLRPPEG